MPVKNNPFLCLLRGLAVGFSISLFTVQASAQSASPFEPQLLEFEAGVAELEALLEIKTDQLQKRYLAELGRMETKAQQSGNLKATVAIIKEKSRVDQAGGYSADQARPAWLEKFAKTYQDRQVALEHASRVAMAKRKQQYLQHLVDLKKSLTQIRKFDQVL